MACKSNCVAFLIGFFGISVLVSIFMPPIKISIVVREISQEQYASEHHSNQKTSFEDLGKIIVTVEYAELVSTEKQPNSEDESIQSDSIQYEIDESNKDEQKELSLPLLTCLLFENDTECNAICSMVGSIYGIPIATGMCDEENQCECNVPSNTSLQDYWLRKYDNEDILRDILEDRNLAEQIFNTLRTSFKTPQQTVQDLHPFLSAKQLKNLQIKDTSVRELFTVDGKFDRAAVEKFVADKLQSLGISSSVELDVYENTLIELLNASDEQNLGYITSEIRRSRNEILNNMLDEYLSNHDIPDLSFELIDDQETLIDILDIAVVNRLITPATHEISDQDDLASKLSVLRSEPVIDQEKKPNTESIYDLRSPAAFIMPSFCITDVKDWILEGFYTTFVEQVQNVFKCVKLELQNVFKFWRREIKRYFLFPGSFGRI